MPTRCVDDLGAVLGADSGISKSEVPRICEGLDETVEAFRNRRLDHVTFPYMHIDATYLNVRNELAPVYIDGGGGRHRRHRANQPRSAGLRRRSIH